MGMSVIYSLKVDLSHKYNNKKKIFLYNQPKRMIFLCARLPSYVFLEWCSGQLEIGRRMRDLISELVTL